MTKSDVNTFEVVTTFTQSNQRKKVDMRRLKSFAFEKLPKDSPLREILLSAENKLDVNVFLARLPLLLRLSRVSGSKERIWNS